MTIRVEQSFVLYAECSVQYNGRAKSTLVPGNYLITHKNDGTLKIDGGSLCTSLNYQPPGAILQKTKNLLVSVRKEETIKIKLKQIHFYKELKEWSVHKINIDKTEAQLRNYIANNIKTSSGLLNINIKEVFIEFKTPVGNIDILAIDVDNVYHVIEVKRGKVNLAACSQLERYTNYFLDIMKDVKDYIASPDISSNASNYMKANHQTWVQVLHRI
jgi:endonuclease